MEKINLTLPIRVNLPDDWIEQVVERLRNDPEAEWVEIIRCKDCKFYREYGCQRAFVYPEPEDFCSRAERKTDGRD